MRMLLKRLLSYLPTNLPVGVTEYKAWIASIIELAGPYADPRAMEYAISTILIHADAKYGALPKQFFVSRLRKSAANQIASQRFQEIKQEQAAEIAAAQQQAQTEATVTETVDVENN